MPLKGGHYAQPVNLEGLAFKAKVSILKFFSSYSNLNLLIQSFHKPRIPLKEDIPLGRPMFSVQLKKGGPAPDSYDIKREIGKDGNPKQECTFGHGYQKYRKVSLYFNKLI